MNRTFKSSHLHIFYKKGVLKKFAEFAGKHLRPLTLLKKNPAQTFSCEFCKFFKNTFRRLLLDFFQGTNRNQIFSIFVNVLLQLLKVMNIINFTIGILYFAKLRIVSFLTKIHARGIQLY